MSDDGFHEIQLNGKQLIVLFIAATAVSVVIFLCGVMVGRGVRPVKGDSSPIAELPASSSASPAAAVTSPPAMAPPTTASKTAAVPESPADDDKSVVSGLQNDDLRDGTLGSDKKKAAAASKTAEAVKSLPAAPKETAAKVPDKPAPTPPPALDAGPPSTVTSGGFAVQIPALRVRSEADAIVKRLVAKGYPAFVLNPLPGKPPVYRVQVGRYPNRADADRIATRLQKEEQFSPWVTR